MPILPIESSFRFVSGKSTAGTGTGGGEPDGREKGNQLLSSREFAGAGSGGEHAPRLARKG